MVAGPEIASLLHDFKDKCSPVNRFKRAHHEQVPSVQKIFAFDVKNLCRLFEEAGNPFSDTSKDLYTLDTKQIMPDNVKQSLESAEETGRTQFKNFVSERIYENTIPFFDAIKKKIPCSIQLQRKKKQSLLQKYQT